MKDGAKHIVRHRVRHKVGQKARFTEIHGAIHRAIHGERQGAILRIKHVAMWRHIFTILLLAVAQTYGDAIKQSSLPNPKVQGSGINKYFHNPYHDKAPGGRNVAKSEPRQRKSLFSSIQSFFKGLSGKRFTSRNDTRDFLEMEPVARLTSGLNSFFRGLSHEKVSSRQQEDGAEDPGDDPVSFGGADVGELTSALTVRTLEHLIFLVVLRV